MTVRAFDVKPLRGPWHIGNNPFTARYIPGTNRLYARARLGCLPGGAGHGGRDIHNDTDDKVLRAVWDGTIHRYGWDDYGNHIGLINSDGDEAFYAHGSAIHVSDGQAVKADTDLGILGSTGQTSGPHLHFELRTIATQWCTAIDPTNHLLMQAPTSKEAEVLLVKKQGVSTVYHFEVNHLQQVSDHQVKDALRLGAVLKELPPNDSVWDLPFDR